MEGEGPTPVTLLTVDVMVDSGEGEALTHALGLKMSVRTAQGKLGLKK